MAVAHSLIVIVYHILACGCSYEDLGYRYFDSVTGSVQRNASSAGSLHSATT
jgi:hypothetical protein